MNDVRGLRGEVQTDFELQRAHTDEVEVVVSTPKKSSETSLCSQPRQSPAQAKSPKKTRSKTLARESNPTQSIPSDEFPVFTVKTSPSHEEEKTSANGKTDT